MQAINQLILFLFGLILTGFIVLKFHSTTTTCLTVYRQGRHNPIYPAIVWVADILLVGVGYMAIMRWLLDIV